MSQIFGTTVQGIGSEAATFADQGMYVLFGDNAPAALADFCYTIAMNPTTAEIVPGQTLILDGASFPVTAVGSLVRKNLDGLGHITINFDGAAEAALEGNLHVAGSAPALTVGSTIVIEG
ncbi:MAG: PTS glucitol/sorbitol transporter subunit IIA [Micropruina sp.]|uniref:PTS glucitol/sorbitol transporter subunit IIA n=1 Tax=Micropruina sp. TaxID=2737536 RepID=UPI0039E53013